jgi:hypothetical protein
MQLFDIVKLIFSNKESEWKTVGRNDKSKNFFMINRIMGINFPVQANQFNKLKVTPAPVVDWWRDTLSPRFTRTPQWIFTKTKKNGKSEKSDEKKNFEVIEDFIRTKYSVSCRDLETLKKFYPDRYQKWMEDVAEQTGIQIKNI